MRFSALRSARMSSTAWRCARVSEKGRAASRRRANAPSPNAPGRKWRACAPARGGARAGWRGARHRRAASPPARPDRYPRALRAGASRRALARRLGNFRSLRVLFAHPFRQRRQALERALRSAGDGALIEAVRQSVDRLDRGQPVELLRCHHPVGMHHLPAAVPELELAGDPARGADRQPRPHPFMIGEEEDQLDVAGVVLDQHLERRPRARVWRPVVLGHLGFDGDDRARNRVANLRARAPVDGRLRQVEKDIEDPRALRACRAAGRRASRSLARCRQGVGRREQGIEGRGTHHAPLAAPDRPGKTDRFQSARRTRKPARGKWTTISPTRSSRRRMAMCCAERETISPRTSTLP